MNPEKFTKKSLEALQLAQQTALRYGNMQIEQAHLLYALLTQENGLTPEILKKIDVDVEKFSAECLRQIERLPCEGSLLTAHLSPPISNRKDNMITLR